MSEAQSSNKNRRFKQRIFLNEALTVNMCSIGGLIKYSLQTRNISSTGLFLDFEKPGRFPFTTSSIMEIWLKIAPDNIVFFNGKMARVVHPEDPGVAVTGPGIAIRIVQIDQDNDRRFHDFMQSLSPEMVRKPGAA